MDELKDYTLKQIFCLSKKHKLQAIQMIIDSISEDAVYNALAERDIEEE